MTVWTRPRPTWSGLLPWSELAEAALDALGVPASLAEVGLQPVAVLAARGHRDLRLKLAYKRELRAVGLVQVLHDLLLLLRYSSLNSLWSCVWN